MIGFEYEFHKQRQTRAMSEAESLRQIKAITPATPSLSHMIGRQLVKLGERLQSVEQPAVSARPAAYDSL